jgi:F-type H+-transporting ATPase subunit a
LAEKYLPFVFTVFLFILVSNWLGLLPGVGSIILKLPYESAPLLRSPSSDLNFTLGLAILAVIFVNLSGIITLGFLKYAKKFINFQNPIKFFVGILELISEIAKMISFSFRLFGNVFAGEVLLTIVGFLVPYFIPLPFLFLEIFVGFIQAFVFAMLTLVFISIAVKEEH